MVASGLVCLHPPCTLHFVEERSMRMRRPRFNLLCLAAVAAAGLAAYPSAQAQDYPTRPVTFITPAAAGNSPDVVTRVVADRLTQIWKQQIVVLNRPGAGRREGRLQSLCGAGLDLHRPADRAGGQDAGGYPDRLHSDRHGGRAAD